MNEFIRDPSLVLYLPLWKLDGAVIRDESAYGHLCTVTGALWRPNGRRFNGTGDHIDCGAPSPFIGGLNEATILVWFNPSDAAEAAQILISRWNGVGARWAVRYIGTQTLQFLFNATDNWVGSDAGIVSLNIFQHLAVVKTASEVRFYKDGEGGGSGASVTPIDIATVNLSIGGYTSGAAYFFPGTIGEILVYNRALTSQEILHNYLATKWRYK